MTDAEAADLIRAADGPTQGRAADALKAIWRSRENAHIERQGRPMRCDCLCYEGGDYVKAWESASAV
jgi:hypothetical protein